MKDEIKEILDSLKDILDEPKGLDEMPNGNLYEYDRSYDLERDEIKVLLDYITNLQEENEGLRLQKDNNYEMAYDYNLKIKEATEYLTSYDSINELMRYETSKDNKGLDRKTMIEMDRRYTIIHHKLLNILQGKSDE